MPIARTTGPATTCVSTADMKLHLRLVGSTEDDLVDAAIEAATDYAEAYMERQIISATYKYTTHAWPAVFRLVELAGDNETAWAQWEATTNKGTRQGVGVYRVRNGQLVYYKDYMNP